MWRRIASWMVCVVSLAFLAQAANGAGFYFLNTQNTGGMGGQIDRVDLDGTARTKLADVRPNPFGNIIDWRGFATDGRHYYYANTNGVPGIWEGQIERTDLDGANRTVVVAQADSQFTNLSDWRGFATDGRHLYYLNTQNGGQIDRTEMDGSKRVTVTDIAPSLYNSIGSWHGFATDGKQFYLLNTNGGSSYRGNIDFVTMNGSTRTAKVLDVEPTPFNNIGAWRGFAVSPDYKATALYQLDESPGTALVADSAGTNDGALIHPARVTKGVAAPIRQSTAYDLQPGGGQGGGVNLGTGGEVKPTGDFTVSFRFQADTLNQFDRLVESMNGTSGTSKGLRIDLGGSPGNHLRALLRDGSGTSMNLQYGGTTLQTGEWYFASVRFDKDGQLQVSVVPDSASLGGSVIADHTGSQTSTLTSGLTYQASRPTVLGVENSSGTATNAFDGRLDDVAFYNSALSDDQVKFVRRFGAANSLPDLAWDAADPGTTPDANWKSNLGTARQWNLSGGADEPVLVDIQSGTRLGQAYKFVGAGKAQANNTLPHRNMNLTAEVWVKPTDFLGQEIIMEAGGDGNGWSLLLDDNQIRFRMDQDSAMPGNDHMEAVGTIDLAGERLRDFIQVVGVVDLVGNAIELYIDGVLVATDSTTGDITAWAGGNADALGSANGSGINIGGTDSDDLNPYGTLDGWIGAVRLHHRMLSADEIAASFAANEPIPEPATCVLLAMGACGAAGYVRRRRRQ